MFVPGLFTSFFDEIISSFDMRDVVGCEICTDCFKVQVLGGFIMILIIVDR